MPLDEKEILDIRELISNLLEDAAWLDGGAEQRTVQLERAAASSLERLLEFIEAETSSRLLP
jgi:hypothetical protein